MTVIRWIKEGKIPAFKTAGGHRRIQRIDLERFCRQRDIPFQPEGEPASRRILIVDADGATRDGLADTARGVDPTLMIELAGDAYSAGCLVTTFRPDLVFLDGRLPGIDVLELVARLAHDPETAGVSIVVVTSGSGASSDVDRAFRARGALACLGRPISSGEAERVVRGVFHLPPPERDGGRGGERGPHDGPAVWIVERDARQAQRLRRDLEDRQPAARVVVHENCYDALIAMGAERPDLVVFDTHGKDGECCEMIRRVKAHFAPRPVVIVASAEAGAEPPRAALLAAGARDLLVKPFGADRLLAYLEGGRAPTPSGPRARSGARRGRGKHAS